MEMGRNGKIRALQRKIEALEEMIMCCQVHGTIGRCFPVSLNLTVPGVRALLERKGKSEEDVEVVRKRRSV